ncbi:MAG: hypothetical protein C0507_07600 [Cyanobacteria bacterium PR.3.49]|nr:hypothetical protein [Cyanobacteria bacterium PR.3.49]
MANSLEQTADVIVKPSAQEIHQGLHAIYGEMKKWLTEQPRCKNADLPCVELTDGDEVVKDGQSPGTGILKNDGLVVKTKNEGERGEPKNNQKIDNEEDVPIPHAQRIER